jgi:hypothetical protein
MSAIKNMIGGLAQFANPAFYKNYYAGIVARTHKDIRAGSARPLFKAMLLVGCTGYVMEYGLVGRYHVADKQAVIKKALADHHH